MWILRSARSAFGSWTMIAGMVAGGITILNFLQRVFELGLHEVFQRVISAYRAVFYTLFDWLTGWIPFTFETWMKDASVLWLILWGAMARIMWLVYEAEIKEKGKRQAYLHGEIPILGGLMSAGPMGVAAAMTLSLAIWPAVFLLQAIQTPHFYKYFHGGYVAESVPDLDPIDYRFDIRLLYLIQLATMFAIACGAIATNNLVS